jgi:hypothetical protein
MRLAIAEFNRAGFSSEFETRQTIQAAAGTDATIEELGLSGLLEDRDFMWLAHSDPERALELAEQLSPREASALVQLAVCRAMHSKLQPQKQPVTVKQESR